MIAYDVIDPDKDQQVCETVRSLIPEADIIYVYGSYNSAYETAESDIDIAIYAIEAIPPKTLWDYRIELMRELRRDHVDLVDLRAVGIVLQYQVVTTGRRLWVRDFEAAEHQEDRIWQLYLTFQDDFKHLWADIKKRGSVYG